MIRGTFGPGTIILGGGALALLGMLVLGFFLPSTWAAGVELHLDATQTELMPLIDSPEGWRAWTAWPDSGLTRSGPEHGAEARIRWADPELGSGAFTIEEAVSGTHVSYSVEVEGAGNSVMRTSGRIMLTEKEGGTLVRWEEEGDLGGNPLMGYWAFFMERVQTAEMSKGLDRLSESAEMALTGEEEAPTDSISMGASDSVGR